MSPTYFEPTAPASLDIQMPVATGCPVCGVVTLRVYTYRLDFEGGVPVEHAGRLVGVAQEAHHCGPEVLPIRRPAVSR